MGEFEALDAAERGIGGLGSLRPRGDEGVAAVTTVKDVITDGGANGNEGVAAITTALVVATWTAMIQSSPALPWRRSSPCSP